MREGTPSQNIEEKRRKKKNGKQEFRCYSKLPSQPSQAKPSQTNQSKIKSQLQNQIGGTKQQNF